uniref:Uncharacterized protein n=1 Tax=Timema bartmani TaxID=61472 RepID=A0A7R9F2S6_9NEOP|nr:unnamed protein product [Timema bartmani]
MGLHLSRLVWVPRQTASSVGHNRTEKSPSPRLVWVPRQTAPSTLPPGDVIIREIEAVCYRRGLSQLEKTAYWSREGRWKNIVSGRGQSPGLAASFRGLGFNARPATVGSFVVSPPAVCLCPINVGLESVRMLQAGILKFGNTAMRPVTNTAAFSIADLVQFETVRNTWAAAARAVDSRTQAAATCKKIIPLLSTCISPLRRPRRLEGKPRHLSTTHQCYTRQLKKELYDIELNQMKALDGIRIHRIFTKDLTVPIILDPLTQEQRSKLEAILARDL